jgi:hypothetical protein
LAFTAAYSILLTSDEVRIITFIIFFISGDRLNPHKGLFWFSNLNKSQGAFFS